MTLVLYPNSILKQQSVPVEPDQDVGDLTRDMLQTMYDFHGIGLAAVQIGVLLRVIVMDASLRERDPLVLINPKIIHASLTREEDREGCLSVPGIYDRVERPTEIVVQYEDAQRKSCVQEFKQIEARCVQHEVDHLDGVLFLDHLSRFKQRRIKAKIEKAAP